MNPGRFEDLEEELHRAAVAATGLEDFGEPDYLTGLRVLLRAYDTDPQLTPIGRQFAYGTVLGTLTARLHTQQGWSQHREVLRQRLEKPLVITGIPRTGTTALHKLLSRDPQFQGLDRWLTETPMIRPPRECWESHPAFRATVANLNAFFAAMPEMRKAHDMVADEPDECLEVLRQSFVSNPEACIIQTHRDPVQAIPSLCSTLYMARRMFEGEATRAEIIGPRECRYWKQALRRTEQVQRSRPQQFFDVQHKDFVADPLGTVRAIYDHFDLELSASARAHAGVDRSVADLQAWRAPLPAGGFRHHGRAAARRVRRLPQPPFIDLKQAQVPQSSHSRTTCENWTAAPGTGNIGRSAAVAHGGGVA